MSGNIQVTKVTKNDEKDMKKVPTYMKYKYYMDINNEWPFFTDEEGVRLIGELNTYLNKAVAIANERIDATDDPAETDKEGEEIYSEKKHKMKKSDPTWTQEEYAHPGLQKRYLKLKSVQRFTEGYSMMQRMYNYGVFSNLDQDEYVCVSLGGGPGFELIATKVFLNELYPDMEVKMISVDLEDGWKEYAKAMGIEFVKSDLSVPANITKIGKKYNADMYMISYVYHIYMTSTAINKALSDLIFDDTFIAIMERSYNVPQLNKFREMDLVVTSMMKPFDNSDKYKKDYRQVIVTSGEFADELGGPISEYNIIENGKYKYNRNYKNIFPGNREDTYKKHTKNRPMLQTFDNVPYIR